LKRTLRGVRKEEGGDRKAGKCVGRTSNPTPLGRDITGNQRKKKPYKEKKIFCIRGSASGFTTGNIRISKQPFKTGGEKEKDWLVQQRRKGGRGFEKPVPGENSNIIGNGDLRTNAFYANQVGRYVIKNGEKAQKSQIILK